MILWFQMPRLDRNQIDQKNSIVSACKNRYCNQHLGKRQAIVPTMLVIRFNEVQNSFSHKIQNNRNFLGQRPSQQSHFLQLNKNRKTKVESKVHQQSPSVYRSYKHFDLHWKCIHYQGTFLNHQDARRGTEVKSALEKYKRNRIELQMIKEISVIICAEFANTVCPSINLWRVFMNL